MPGRYKRKLPEDLVQHPTVVAYDPGGTTGWSVLSFHAESLSEPDVSMLDNIEHWTHGEIDCDMPASYGKRTYSKDMEIRGIQVMVDIAEAWPGAVLLIEDFIMFTQRKDRETLTPVRLIAMFDYAMAPNNVYRQMPSEKGGATDERLKEWNLYEREGGAGHARDADRHGIVLMRKAKAKRATRHTYWPHLYDMNGILIG